MKQQSTEMNFSPDYGKADVYPKKAQEWREFHGDVAWIYNPWTGDKRDPRDIGSDVLGLLIIPPNESIVYA